MKIEAGKYYRTKHGQKVYAVGREPFLNLFVIAMATGDTYEVTDDGCCCSLRFGLSDKWNIVAEWREPVSREVTVYLFRNGGVAVTNQGQFPLFPACDVIARKTITITEGDGMEPQS